MSFRSDVTVDWSVSPRIIEIAAPSINIIAQDLYDTLAELQAQVHNQIYPIIISAGGKSPLGGGIFTAVTNELLDAKIKFEDRPGPSTVFCTITGGNVSNPTLALEPSTFVYAVIVNETGGVVAETDVSGLTSQESSWLQRAYEEAAANMTLDNTTGIQVILDEFDVPIAWRTVYSDIAKLTPWTGGVMLARDDWTEGSPP